MIVKTSLKSSDNVVESFHFHGNVLYWLIFVLIQLVLFILILIGALKRCTTISERVRLIVDEYVHFKSNKRNRTFFRNIFLIPQKFTNCQLFCSGYLRSNLFWRLKQQKSLSQFSADSDNSSQNKNGCYRINDRLFFL